MDTIDNEQALHFHSHVTTLNNRQFITGEVTVLEQFLPESVYSQALDSLVIGCVDVIPFYSGRILIGLRSWEPQPSWWCFGGRMHKGELYQIAAIRNVQRELFYNNHEIEIAPDRFMLIGIYNLIWDTRAQVPVKNGSHVISVTMMLPLRDDEITLLRPNEEYECICWVQPEEVSYGIDKYHPCLIQMAKDIINLLALRSIK